MWAGKNGKHLVLVFCLRLTASPIPARCDSRQLIPQQSIRNAISEFLGVHGWGELPQNARLDWPESLPFAAAQARLQVAAADWDKRLQAAQFHLRCVPRSACVDFLVQVALPASAAGDWQRQLAATVALPLARTSSSLPSLPLLAKRGHPAVLILQGGGVRVSLPVICTEPGVLHQRIRVVDRRGQRSYYADVVAEGLLQATL